MKNSKILLFIFLSICNFIYGQHHNSGQQSNSAPGGAGDTRNADPTFGINIASKKFEAGDFEAALDLADKVKKAHEDTQNTAYSFPNKYCYHLKAHAEYELDDFTGAIDECNKGIEAKASDIESKDINGGLYLQRGLCKKIMGDEAGTKDDFKSADLEGYLEMVNKWIKNMDRADIGYNSTFLEKVRVLTALGKSESALKVADDAIKLNSNFAPVYRWRGDLKLATGDYKGALADCNTALGFRPTYAACWRSRGWARYKMGKLKEALADFDKAIKLNKNLFLTFYQRGVCKAKLGKPKDAVPDFDTAIKLNGKYAKAYYHRGLAEKELGDEKGSQEDLDKAVELAEAEEN